MQHKHYLSSAEIEVKLYFMLLYKYLNIFCQIIKWPDLKSLDDCSLGIKMVLIVKISVSASIHKDKDYTTYM